MFKAYWGMSRNPFTKEIDVKDVFQSEDIRQVTQRLEHLKKYPGIALITAAPGMGKTLGLRCFTENLNPNMYKTVYQKITNISETEFFRMIAAAFGLETSYRKGDNIEKINARMKKLVLEQKVMPVIIVDDAQGIRKNDSYFQSFQELMNFDMDSRNYGILIIAGHTGLNDTLSLDVNEALHQRIVVNYELQGMSPEEVREYVSSRMALADATDGIFDPAAITALYECSRRSVRRLNKLCKTALLIGANDHAKTITADTIREAAAEIALIKD